MMERMGAMFMAEVWAPRDAIRKRLTAFRRTSAGDGPPTAYESAAMMADVEERRQAERYLEAKGIAPDPVAEIIAEPAKGLGPIGRSMKKANDAFRDFAEKHGAPLRRAYQSDPDRMLRRTRRMKSIRMYRRNEHPRASAATVASRLSDHATLKIVARRAEVKEARRLRKLAASA